MLFDTHNSHTCHGREKVYTTHLSISVFGIDNYGYLGEYETHFHASLDKSIS